MLRIFQHERRRILLRRLLSTTRSPYQVLDIPQSASKSDVKKAYIAKAKKCHPDLFPDNEKKTKEFQELQEAYSILSDTKKKAEYTQMERAAQAQAYGNPMPKHPFTGHAGMPPRNNSFGNSRFTGASGGAGGARNDPLHDMVQEMLRAQRKQYQSKFGGTGFEKEAKVRGARWDRIIARLVFAYIVLWIFFGNLRLETNERKRRMSEFESDMKIQNEVMGTLVKYVYGPKDSKLQTLDIRSKKLSLSNKDKSSDAKEDDI
ncbi:chaperone protein DnaJ-like isoform X2 [Bolinopsis microptera]|uniref:chaperone protein DnaJ-like isoform X2 n=1 Tax=Bolinopsis microptera TaxID=2820187 RepID=UPI00307A0CA8